MGLIQDAIERIRQNAIPQDHFHDVLNLNPDLTRDTR